MNTNAHNPFPDPFAEHLINSLAFIDKALGKASEVPARAAAMSKPVAASVHIEEFSLGRRDEFEATVELGEDSLIFVEGTASEDGVIIDECRIVGAEKCRVYLDAATETRLEADLYDRWREVDREMKSRGREEE